MKAQGQFSVISPEMFYLCLVCNSHLVRFICSTILIPFGAILGLRNYVPQNLISYLQPPLRPYLQTLKLLLLLFADERPTGGQSCFDFSHHFNFHINLIYRISVAFSDCDFRSLWNMAL